MKSDSPSVRDVLRSLTDATNDARRSIESNPALETVRFNVMALSDRCLEAIEDLDQDDPFSSRAIRGLNEISFAAHALAKGIQSGSRDHRERYVHGMRYALSPTRGARTPGHNILRFVSLQVSFDRLGSAVIRVPGIRAPRSQTKKYSSRRTTSLARTLLAAAARLVPAADRPRYTAEFRAELADLTAAGGNRRAQVAYAARLVVTAPRLRLELKAPRRRSAPQ
jgi:hypothetical protein